MTGPGTLTDTSNRTVAVGGVVVGLLALVGSLVTIGGVDLGRLATGVVFDGWVLLWLGLATIGLRSLGTLDIARSWLLGWFVVYLVVWLLGTGTGLLLGTDSGLQRVVVVPVLEEGAKLLPVVGFVTFLRRRHVWPTLSDLLLVGFAVGAAFGMREDVLRARVAGDGFAGVWGMLFPSTIHLDGRLVLTHSGWTLVAAAGVGLAMLHRRTWARVVGAALVLLPVLDHAAQNARGAAGERMAALLGDGALLGLVLVVVVVGSIVHDAVVLHVVDRDDTLLSSAPLWRIGALVGRSPRAAMQALAYRRLRTGGHLHSWRTRRADEPLGDRSRLVDRLRSMDPRLTR